MEEPLQEIDHWPMRAHARIRRPRFENLEGACRGGVRKLPEQPAFADSGRSHECNHLAVTVEHGTDTAVEKAQLGPSADERAEPASGSLARPMTDEPVVLLSSRPRTIDRLEHELPAEERRGGGGGQDGAVRSRRRQKIERARQQDLRLSVDTRRPSRVAD